MGRIYCLLAGLLLYIAASLAVLPVAAQSTPTQTPMSEEQRRTELHEAVVVAVQAGTRGPASVALLDQATVNLPEGDIYVPKPEATRLMRAIGNTVGSNFVGVVISANPRDGWYVTVNYVNEGYVKDDDAKNWNADELLDNLKSGTEEGNQDRRARGFPEIEILGWVQKPTYDATRHQLVWSLSTKDKNGSDDDSRFINYNTYALGRGGFLSLNLVTSSATIDADKAVAADLLGNLTYNPGKAYTDFNSSTDHIAAYGLAALVGGIALKKLGILAIVAGFAAKFAKFIVIGVIALGAGFKRLFPWRRRDDGSS